MEAKLPGVVEELEDRCQLVADDVAVLIWYAAEAFVRHRAFEAMLADFQSRRGVPPPSNDDVQRLRVQRLSDLYDLMAKWRWRVLHSPARRAQVRPERLGVSEIS